MEGQEPTETSTHARARIKHDITSKSERVRKSEIGRRKEGVGRHKSQMS